MTLTKPLVTCPRRVAAGHLPTEDAGCRVSGPGRREARRRCRCATVCTAHDTVNVLVRLAAQSVSVR